MIEETAEPQQQQKSEQNKPKQFVLDRNSLQEYYQQNFPINQFYDWLCYSESQEYFQKREFSFTFPGDVYWRYIFFNSKEHLLQTLIEKVPEKIDIGAVFNKQGQKGDMNLKAIEKEFVIDIDMTDYDNIRTCCTGANICEKCWKFMKYACELISKTLEDFDFKHVLWVYSGRRGIHAWICDSNVRKSSDKIRSCIIEHMNLIIDNDKSDHYLKSQLVNLKSHYLIDRAFLKDGDKNDKFEEIILQDQDLFMKKPKLILDFVNKRCPLLYSRIVENWKSKNTSKERYLSLKNEIEINKDNKNKDNSLKNFMEELKIWLLYPRLDVNVSKTTNHLLKSPFCIHPKTGNICVPFTSKEIQNFNPFDVPNMSSINSVEGQRKFNEYLNLFKNFVNQVKNEINN